MMERESGMVCFVLLCECILAVLLRCFVCLHGVLCFWGLLNCYMRVQA